jgi:hypothetical protein
MWQSAPPRAALCRRRRTVNKSFRDWLSEGEQLYNASMNEFKAIESQLDALEQQLAAKKAEVNQIAQVIGKPPVESTGRRLTAQLIESEQVASTNAAVPPGNIARALSGRGSLIGR